MSLWTDFLGAEVQTVDIAGVRTRVLRAGDSGPTVVLLHGRGGHLEGWRANVSELARDHRVIAFDLLGHGLTARHSGGYGVAELAGHALSTVGQLAEEPATLVGQSIGGWIAVLIALRARQLVRALVLVEPAGLQSEEERLADPKVAAAYSRGGKAFDQPSIETVRARLEGLVSEPAQIDDELVEARLALYRPSEARDVHRLVRAADNSRLVLTPELLAQLSVPVLWIHGDAANTPREIVERAAAAARAQLHVVDGAKQWPQLERPEIVNSLIAKFSARNGACLCPSG